MPKAAPDPDDAVLTDGDKSTFIDLGHVSSAALLNELGKRSCCHLYVAEVPGPEKGDPLLLVYRHSNSPLYAYGLVQAVEKILRPKHAFHSQGVPGGE